MCDIEILKKAIIESLNACNADIKENILRNALDKINSDERYFPYPTKKQRKYWNSEKYKRITSTQNLRP